MSYVYISYVPCLLSFIIYVCVMCRFCNLPSACWLGTLVNMKLFHKPRISGTDIHGRTFWDKFLRSGEIHNTLHVYNTKTVTDCSRGQRGSSKGWERMDIFTCCYCNENLLLKSEIRVNFVSTLTRKLNERSLR
jgi:hypothetical protein